MRRLFAWQTDTAGCWYYRLHLPLTHLPGCRWDVRYGTPGPDIGDYDVVIGQRLAGPQPDWLRLCADPNVLCVYDADDDLTDLDPQNTVPYSIYAPLAADTRRNIEAADVVTVCVPAVAEKLSKWNSNVHLLPICIDPAVIDWPVRRGPAALTVGWAGSPFHHQDWGTMPAHLAEYMRRVPHATFHTIGADYTGGVLGHRTRVTGWSTVDNFYKALDFDIGIAPLDPALRGSATRSHTKLLEYAARGIPAVATAAGQYRDWVEPGVNGLLVSDESQWVEYLVAMSDDTVRAPMSAAARAKARQFTIDRHIGLWERAYSGEAG